MVKINPLKWFAKDPPPVYDMSGELAADFNKVTAYNGGAPAVTSWFDGSKFPGGFGATQLFQLDYWALRERSAQLFRENLYAKGLIRRLITNEINSGVTPEACPDEAILGVPDDSLDAWTEDVENRFNIWGKNPSLCDWKLQSTFGAIQRAARREALICGDVLVIVRASRVTRLPMIELIEGQRVQSPFHDTKLRNGHRIEHGVELDAHGRQVAYWVQQDDGKIKRVPAWGERTGRRISWLVYGTELRLDEVRGEPLLSIVLQSLKEIDRYRDSTQRKAVINSILAMLVTKSEPKMGSLPISGGAVRNDTLSTTDSDGTTRQLDIANQIPGLVIQEMQQGEDVVLKGGEGTDLNFGPFEEAVIQSVAWANEVPPEILRLSFSSNYSASMAAINEFRMYLEKFWSEWGETFCTPIYIEWLIAETLLGKIKTPALLNAWRDPQQYDIFGAITMVEWYGSVKPSTDPVKTAKGSKLLVDSGFSTYARESRGNNGTKFSKNVKRLKKENTQLAEARRPLAEFQQEFNQPVDVGPSAEVLALDAAIDDYLIENGVVSDD